VKAEIIITFEKNENEGNSVENLDATFINVNPFEVIGVFEMLSRNQVVGFLAQQDEVRKPAKKEKGENA